MHKLSSITFISIFFLSVNSFAQKLMCPTDQQIQASEQRLELAIQASNDLTLIANEAADRNQLSATLAIGSGTLLISSSLATYYFSLNPGLVGSVVTFMRLPTGVAGATAGLAISNALRLSSISTILSNTVIVTLSTAAAHLESVYLISQGIYQLSLPTKKMTFTDSDIQKSAELLNQALAKTNLEIEQLLENPPSAFKNSLHLGRPNAQHFQKIADLSQLRVLLMKELTDQLVLRQAVCQD